jgi:hypothetical protein
LKAQTLKVQIYQEPIFKMRILKGQTLAGLIF